MKAILISIRPKWCELIANGKKTVEIRKTKPKIETPFKVYIYCTKGKPFMKTAGNSCFIDEEYRQGENLFGLYELINGEVIGEFVCDKIFDIKAHYDLPTFYNQYECGWIYGKDDACLSFDEMNSYLKGNDGHGWHISDLVIYDKPKELSEFKKAGFLTEEEWLAYLYPNTHCHYEAWAKKFDITRPPQSWCCVEELKGA